MAFDASKFLARFVEETREHCSRLSEGLLNLEKSPGDRELLNGLFRSAHTIKGSAKMMKVTGIAELAHRMEDVLDALRGGRIFPDTVVSDMLFRGVDALTALLATVSSGEKFPPAPAALCEALSRVAASMAPSDPPALPVIGEAGEHCAEAPDPKPSASIPMTDERGVTSPAGKTQSVDYLHIRAAKLDDLIRLMGEIVSEQGKFRAHVGRIREIERALARHLATVAERFDSEKESDVGAEALVAAGSTLRFSLRQAMRALSDMMLMQDHLVADLQESSLQLRMQPLSTVFNPLRRTVRDLSREHGKEIDFVVEGGETELDRKIIDQIGDSLLHMIRNSLDHGLESAEERSAAGKPSRGTIRLSACYDGGCVTIALGDDGSGLPTDLIREKALAKRLLTAQALAGMSRAEIDDIIFTPGFSTSRIITDLSGRGVGMDVVRKNIVDELKGSISIDSRPGEGTTFFLRLPPNLAVFSLLLVSVAGKTCALPATSIVEVHSVPAAKLIGIVNKRAVRLREELIPVELLAAIVNLPVIPVNTSLEVLMVILQDGNERLGLIVDGIIGREEMVVKPLPFHLRNLKMVSGVTIGPEDGIINVFHGPELLRAARQVTVSGQRAPAGQKDRDTRILVVDDSFNTREIEKSILEAYGYVVVTAGDGEEAIEKTRHEHYDLIVTDVEMPKMDGFTLTETLRNDKQYGNVPIIIVTSREKEEDKKRGIRVGANAYIVKGAFDQSNLLDTVRGLIG
ncbi:MAG: hybrid sensor histidine kinase/response regulator [Pseudomonadota bacterium]